MRSVRGSQLTAPSVLPPGEAQESAFECSAAAAFAPLRIHGLGPQPFSGRFRTAGAGGLVVTDITASPYDVIRTPRLIRSTDREMIKVEVQRRGRGTIDQNGHQGEIRPGTITVYETIRPYRLRFDEPSTSTVVGIPRELLGAHGDRVSGRVGRVRPLTDPVSRAIATVAAAATAGPATTGPGPEAGHVGDALLSLVLAWLTGAPEEDPALGRRALTYAEVHLADPRLSPLGIARVHGVSLRQLQRAMAAEGVHLGDWVRRRRLELIRDDILDPENLTRPLSAIAAARGLNDATHLGRALRATLGCSAQELRARAREQRR